MRYASIAVPLDRPDSRGPWFEIPWLPNMSSEQSRLTKLAFSSSRIVWYATKSGGAAKVKVLRDLNRCTTGGSPSPSVVGAAASDLHNSRNGSISYGKREAATSKMFSIRKSLFRKAILKSNSPKLSSDVGYASRGESIASSAVMISGK